MDDIQERWIAGHLYYHQGLDRVVRGFVHPVVSSLVKDGEIDGFFFVRFSLGGPHIRLRLRAVPGAGERVLEAMRQAARRFLELEPSTRSLDEEAIRRTNEYILASDPHETDDSVYPDNSLQVMPFRPEVERYGGLSLFRMSIDFFTLSSVAAVEFLSEYQEAPRSAQLAHAFRLLLWQALGLAADPRELADLLRYGVDSWGELRPKIVEKGDRVAETQRDFFLQLFRRCVEDVRSLLAQGGPFNIAADFLVAGASQLSAAVASADRETRARIGGSQLHMTASRLGLSTAEEVYLSRLLSVTLREMSAEGADLSWLGERLAGFAEDPEKALGKLLSPALALFPEPLPAQGIASSGTSTGAEA